MSDFPDANQDSVDAWQANAEFWDALQGDDGNYWQCTLVFPPTMELLQPLPATLLEIACGNGNFARAAARAGAAVTATDASERLLELARVRTAADSGIEDTAISWQRVDATDADALRLIERAPFGAAVCNMALMDIAEIGPLFEALPLLLDPGAPFVASVLHPAFNQGPDTVLFRERIETDDGRLVQRTGVRISRYKSQGVSRGIASVGQPSLQPYFNRSLETLLGAAFERGWVLDALREPSLDIPDPESESRLSWDDLAEIPPVIVLRFRHRGQQV